MRHALPLALLFALSGTVLAAETPPDAPAVPAVPDITSIADEHIDEALTEAGENRAQLESALTRASEGGDAERIAAMRFLVANMTGKGYVRTELQDEDGNAVPYDSLAYEKYAQSRAAIDALEKEHGELHWARGDLVKDTQTITADFLIQHVDLALERWRASPVDRRVGFDAFLNFVLPYRGSNEPLDTWLAPLSTRYAETPTETQSDVRTLYEWVTKDIAGRVKFDERFYLHPTDQGFSEMQASRQGRCEDITNMQTFAARSLALATAADYTPAWARRDNNHAWNVLLNADGTGFTKAYAHAAKIYRKTFALQRDNLAYRLPKGREAANRFMSSKGYIDVTDQYAPNTDVTVTLDPEAIGDEGFAYLCVFNGGDWSAIHWSPITDGKATFTKMGRDIVYLPAVHDGEKLIPATAPLLLHKNGVVETLAGGRAKSGLLATSLQPRQKSVDTFVETPVSFLEEGTEYVLQRWENGAWTEVERFTADADPRRFDDLETGALYWMVKSESRRLERVFTIESGRQRWW